MIQSLEFLWEISLCLTIETVSNEQPMYTKEKTKKSNNQTTNDNVDSVFVTEGSIIRVDFTNQNNLSRFTVDCKYTLGSCWKCISRNHKSHKVV